MVRNSWVAAAIVTSASCAAGTRDAPAVVRNARIAMGADTLTSIQYSGSAAQFGVGQSDTADGPWPHIFDYKITRAFDFARPATHVTIETLPTSPLAVPAPPGGAPPPAPRTFHMVTDAGAPWAQQLEIWTTPWGFLRGATDNPATVETRTTGGKRYDVVSWVSPQKSPSGVPYRLNGYINDQGMVEKIETWLEDEFFGDMLVETLIADYKDFGGVKVPATIAQQHGGWPGFSVTIARAVSNPPDIAQLMEAPAQPGGPPPGPGFEVPPAQSDKLADGVFRITGGYVALAVEFADHIVIIEGPDSQARALAIMAEARKAIPDKPIKYVVNTHHHSDHAGGLPAFAAEGVTIITHENNRKLLDRAFNGARTLALDRLGGSKRKAQFETVRDSKVLKDATRAVELHHIVGLAHADGMLIAYLPNERIVVQADMAFIGPFQPAPGERRAATLVENLERLKLNYDTVVFVHAPEPDRRVTKADLLMLAAQEN